MNNPLSSIVHVFNYMTHALNSLLSDFLCTVLWLFTVVLFNFLLQIPHICLHICLRVITPFHNFITSNCVIT